MPHELVSALDGNLSLPSGFLGTLKQVCVATYNLRKTVEGMLRCGIGPWKVYTLSPETCTELTYHGRPADFSVTIGLADTPSLNWEVIQPLAGVNIYSDFLSSNGEGLHHLLFDCGGIGWKEKTAAFKAAGYSCIQSGRWLGRTTFAYYGTDAAMGAVLEIVDIPPDWHRPEPEEVYG